MAIICSFAVTDTQERNWMVAEGYLVNLKQFWVKFLNFR